MKALIYGSLLVMLTVLSWPTRSEAFSRRSHSSEMGGGQAVTTPLPTTTTENGNVSAQAVPEPPLLVLVTIG
jgi:hypothetical protein